MIELRNKTIDILLVLIILTLIGSYLLVRNQAYSEAGFMEQLLDTEQYIRAERWEDAQQSSGKVEEKWKRIKFWVMLNYAEADISAFEEYLQLMVGGTESRDSVTALSSSLYIQNLWRNMKKFVPQP